MKAASETSRSRSPESTRPALTAEAQPIQRAIDACGQDRRRERRKVEAERHERAEEQGVGQAGRGVEGGEVGLLRLGASRSAQASATSFRLAPASDRARAERAHEQEEGLAGAGPVPARRLGERAPDDRERPDRQEDADQIEQPAVGPEPAVRDDADRLVGLVAQSGSSTVATSVAAAPATAATAATRRR